MQRTRNPLPRSLCVSALSLPLGALGVSTGLDCEKNQCERQGVPLTWLCHTWGTLCLSHPGGPAPVTPGGPCICHMGETLCLSYLRGGGWWCPASVTWGRPCASHTWGILCLSHPGGSFPCQTGGTMCLSYRWPCPLSDTPRHSPS